MLNRCLGLLLTTSLGVTALPAAAAPSDAPEVQKPVELSRYLGHWYEYARYDNRFEQDCAGVTADYARRSDGLVDILNTCTPVAAGKPARTARAKAYVIDGTAGAKLKVSFFGPFFMGDYWVLDHAEDYSWAIVGGPSRRWLWILTREPKIPSALAAQLIERARKLGFDTTKLHIVGVTT